VIVLNYNGASSIQKCVESILAQSYTPSEIILVDNDSSDGSADSAQQLFPTVRVIRNSENLGFAEGNNVGIRKSQGDLVLLANNDIVLEREAVSRLVRQASLDVGLVGGAIQYADGERIWSYGGLFDPFTGMHWHAFQGMSGKTRLPQNLQVDYVPGALLLARRSLLERVGLLDDYFFLYGDDVDLALKAQRLGYSIRVTPEAVAYHLVSRSVRKLEEKYRLLGYYLMNKNMFYLYFTQLPLPFAITSTLSQMVFLLFEMLLFQRPVSYLSAKIRALAHVTGDLGRIRHVRGRVHRLGVFRARPRFRDFLAVARSRASTRTYYW
jgi:GT2 family glycosyltransferase